MSRNRGIFLEKVKLNESLQNYLIKSNKTCSWSHGIKIGKKGY